MDAPLVPKATPTEAEYFSGEGPPVQTGPSSEERGTSLAQLMEVKGDPLAARPSTEDARPGPGLPDFYSDAFSRPRRIRRLGLLAAKIVLPLAVLASLTFNYSEVRGASMMPGIHDRDRILVDHLTYAFLDIDRGDVVVLRYPLDPRMDYIKRVVGLPGDEIVIQYGGVWVNGDPVEEPYVAVKALDPYTSVRAIVKPGHYFVLGDNRIRSSDSREFGQVPQELVRGLVRLRVWPPDRFGWIH